MAGGQFIGVDKVTQTLQMIYQGHINIDQILDGKITISDKLKVTCPNIKITGDVDITGKVHVSGEIVSDTEVKAKSVTLTGHTHQYTAPQHAAGNTNTTTGQG